MVEVLEDDSTTGSPRALIDQPGPQNLVVVDWAAASVQGRQRLHNEDSWRQLGPIFVLADGMGGLSGGADASRIAVDVVANQWLAHEAMAPAQVVRAANDRVRESVVDGEARGCTLTAVRISQDQATIVHVGDSRAYRVRSGVAELLTRDHNLRSELLAAGIVPGSSSAFGPLRALTSYLGKPHGELEVDVRSVSLRSGDRLMLCTDGVFEGLRHSEIVVKAFGGTASEAAHTLTSMHASDDATAIVIDVNVDEG